MGGFFRKVAGAFVYLDDDKPKPPASANLDDVARETGDLIAQLGGEQAIAAASTAESAAAAPMLAEMTANQVFAAASLTEGPNSAQRVLKIIAGLSMFPREQQLLMVRAMDAADDAWSEKQVLDDAMRRQAVLRAHLQRVEAERTGHLQSVAARIANAESQGRQAVAEVDQRIQELQKLRQEMVESTTSALKDMQQEQKRIEEKSEKARQGITTVFNALSELVAFFGQGEPPRARS
jgi:hypothetical protein